jgi:hypothetical protein
MNDLYVIYHDIQLPVSAGQLVPRRSFERLGTAHPWGKPGQDVRNQTVDITTHLGGSAGITGGGPEFRRAYLSYVEHSDEPVRVPSGFKGKPRVIEIVRTEWCDF